MISQRSRLRDGCMEESGSRRRECVGPEVAVNSIFLRLKATIGGVSSMSDHPLARWDGSEVDKLIELKARGREHEKVGRCSEHFLSFSRCIFVTYVLLSPTEQDNCVSKARSSCDVCGVLILQTRIVRSSVKMTSAVFNISYTSMI